MSEETNVSEVEQTEEAPSIVFYGLDYEGNIEVFEKSEYANQAYRKYVHACEEQGVPAKDFILIFTEHQYRALLSQVDNELNDVDGDTLIPTYFVVSFQTLLAVFPHPSVDTEEEVTEFIKGYPIEIAGPYKLSEVAAKWPRPADPQTTVTSEQT